MELIEGYYDCVPERSVDDKLGPCTVYTAYWDGRADFTVCVYDNDPYCISIKEGKDG
jgi:hypothetical protein